MSKNVLVGEASQATYQAMVDCGLSEEIARDVARRVRKTLSSSWRRDHLLEAMNLDNYVQARVDRGIGQLRQTAKGVRAEQPLVMDRQDHELALLRRQRVELLAALSEATGETMTTLALLYGDQEIVPHSAEHAEGRL